MDRYYICYDKGKTIHRTQPRITVIKITNTTPQYFNTDAECDDDYIKINEGFNS